MEKKTSPIFYIPLVGVENEQSVRIIEKGIREVNGIETLKVELNNKRTVVSGSQPSLLKDTVLAIRNLGYGVTSVKKDFPVMQMSCASCALHVERSINNLSGIIHASVNFATEKLSVEYLPNMIQANDLQKTVQSIGYNLLTDEDANEPITIEAIQDEQLTELKWKTIGASGLSILLVIIGMFFLDTVYANEIMWLLATPVVFWFGKEFFIHAWKQAKHRSANMDTLVALSTGVAYTFSIFTLLFPNYWQDRGVHAHVYFESAAVVITFILLGKLLEQRTKYNTAYAIKKLIGLQPTTVTVISSSGVEIETSVHNIKKDDMILVKPGQKIAVDGVVLGGTSYVDESTFTGEAVPSLKSQGEKVLAGTINQKGSFTFRAEQIGADTLLAQIIRIVQEAQGSKAPIQKLVDRVASIFVPVVICIAVISFGMWWWLGGENGFAQGLMAFVTVLVIACPCALGLATPTAITVGVGRGAEKGILIRDAESLEIAKNVNAIVLDKTGTITEGKPTLTDWKWLDDNEATIPILCSIEKKSEHPLAQAIANQWQEVIPADIFDFQSVTGRGVHAIVNTQRYWVGHKKWLLENRITIDSQLLEKEKIWRDESKSIVWFADESRALAVLAVADRIKPTSVDAIQQLHQMKMEVFMLTGDQESTARAIAKQVGIQQYQSEVLPNEKARFIKNLQAKGKTVAMIGDGINDSAALAQADVSMAMGKGSDIAMDVAKMTIISSDLTKVPMAIQLSKRTVSIIRQNLFWAFIFNVAGIPLAAGILFPVNGFLLNPMIAGAAMALSSVSVVTNSLRLKWIKWGGL